MKDTVEEEIYKINKEEDKKFKDNVDLIDKMIEMDDDKINATNEDIEKMTKNAEQYNKTKVAKKPTKKIGAPVVQNNILNDSDLSDSDLSDDD
jgi:PDZ domain-containing secreted protein